MIILIVISVLCGILSGLFKAICDLSEENKLKFKPSRFWIKSHSWVNKWKNWTPENGERFWGSSRWFVSFTDAWHLFGLLQRITFATSFAISGFMAGKYGLIWLSGLKVNYIIFALAFHLFYNSKKLRS